MLAAAKLTRPSLLAYAWLVASTCLHFGCADVSANADDAGPQADAGPQQTVTSDAKHLQIEAYTAPDQPPSRGLSTVTLQVVDAATGKPQDGLQLTAVPWMPAHGHGTSIKTVVAADGGGRYVVSRVNLFMGGEWDLRLSFSGASTDRATLHFSIP